MSAAPPAAPFLVILDEMGYYTAPGFATLSQIARSAGYGFMRAPQDAVQKSLARHQRKALKRAIAGKGKARSPARL